ncbi:MAG: tyrosine--tRNA ligase [Clostridiaceae bacterium]
MISVEEQLKIISKGVSEIINIQDLKEKLAKGKPLIVKLGLDPSAPDIHLGHAVILRKLKQIQDLGHNIVIIIGDFTGMIGDPTGKSTARKKLTREQVLENSKTYKDQIFKILDEKKTKVKFNSEWLSKLNLKDVIDFASNYTVGNMLKREDLKSRVEANVSIGLQELFYPLMQGYDSVKLKADIEIGGIDQKFNILMGRTLQVDYNQSPQIGIFMPLLEGTDGIVKMSKSIGNYIGINEKPYDIFRKVMSIPDELIINYYNLATDIHPDEIDNILRDIENKKITEFEAKMSLAKEITRLYHGDNDAVKAKEKFLKVYKNDKATEDLNEIYIKNTNIDIIKLLMNNKLVQGRSQCKKLVSEGLVKINGDIISHFEKLTVHDEDIIEIAEDMMVKVKVQK